MEKEELLEIRENLGLTQSQLAKHLKVAPNTISRWELGERKIPEFLDLALETIQRKLSLEEAEIGWQNFETSNPAKDMAKIFRQTRGENLTDRECAELIAKLFSDSDIEKLEKAIGENRGASAPKNEN